MCLDLVNTFSLKITAGLVKGWIGCCSLDGVGAAEAAADRLQSCAGLRGCGLDSAGSQSPPDDMNLVSDGPEELWETALCSSPFLCVVWLCRKEG